MIKKITLALAAIVLMASCSNKFSLVKRKYNKGYHFNLAKNNPGEKQIHTSEKVASLKPIETKKLVTETQDAEIIPQQINQAPLAEVSTSGKQAKASKPVLQANAKQKDVVVVKNFKAVETVVNQLQKNNAGAAKGDSDVKLIILVILAIIIPPLAVFLKNNGVSKWFWITLILWLLSFSFFFFFFGGLGWLIAMIIALLYVLDYIK